MTDIGCRIKNRRKALGLSAEDIADIIGVSPATIYRYESGDIMNVRIDKLTPIANALRTTEAFLMGWTDDPDQKAISSFDDSLSSNEQALLECYRSLNDSGKKAMEDYAQLLSSSEQYTKKKGDQAG